MKKIIITIAIVGFGSLGFTIIDKESIKNKIHAVETVKTPVPVSAETTDKESNKHLASWD